MNLLLSIHPRYSDLIFSKIKKYELRRRLPGLSRGDIVWVYETTPTQAVVGYFTVKQVHMATPQSIWRKAGPLTCVEKSMFDSYYGVRTQAFAIEIESAVRLKRKIALETLRAEWPGFSPPQSFRYVPDDINLRRVHRK